jgi:long-chain acyl-CoA synthetase
MAVQSCSLGHAVTPEETGTLDGLLRERVKRTPDAVAYRDFNRTYQKWRDYSWAQIDREVARWQAALDAEGLKAGERVAVMMRNSPEWVVFDQAALGLGLVVVPLYTQDRPDNVAYILGDSGCRVLLFGSLEQWQSFAGVREQLGGLVRILIAEPFAGDAGDPRVKPVAQWLPEEGGATRHLPTDDNALATIVYTSGTTGKPKGVMLSHRNIVSNAYASLQVMTVGCEDVFLSFLPLSHMFERACGYYLTVMSGSTVVFARSVQQLSEDLQTQRPTMLISVPRIYERIHAAIKTKLDEGPPLRRKLFELTVTVGNLRFEHAQGRGGWQPQLLLWPLLNALVAKKVLVRLGGNLRAALSGGAALPPAVARVFIGLGLNVLQGYGMTETSPVACANSVSNNLPASVGTAIPGVEVKIGEHGALMIRGPNVMLGYWNNREATAAMIAADGWLNSGDTARIDGQGHVFITGRLKEIIVMSNGEKIPPVDIEAAIMRDTLFEHVMLIGEGRPFLSLLTVLNRECWKQFAAEQGIGSDAAAARAPETEKKLLARVAAQMKGFPGYAQVRKVTAVLEPWTVEDGLLTPTLKLKRPRVLERFNAEIDHMYAGH